MPLSAGHNSLSHHHALVKSLSADCASGLLINTSSNHQHHGLPQQSSFDSAIGPSPTSSGPEDILPQLDDSAFLDIFSDFDEKVQLRLADGDLEVTR
jgi:hypothetical protein